MIVDQLERDRRRPARQIDVIDVHRGAAQGSLSRRIVGIRAGGDEVELVAVAVDVADRKRLHEAVHAAVVTEHRGGGGRTDGQHRAAGQVRRGIDPEVVRRAAGRGHAEHVVAVSRCGLFGQRDDGRPAVAW